MSTTGSVAHCSACGNRKRIAARDLCWACYQRRRRAGMPSTYTSPPHEYWSAQLAQYFATPSAYGHAADMADLVAR